METHFVTNLSAKFKIFLHAVLQCAHKKGSIFL